MTERKAEIAAKFTAAGINPEDFDNAKVYSKREWNPDEMAADLEVQVAEYETKEAAGTATAEELDFLARYRGEK